MNFALQWLAAAAVLWDLLTLLVKSFFIRTDLNLSKCSYNCVTYSVLAVRAVKWQNFLIAENIELITTFTHKLLSLSKTLYLLSSHLFDQFVWHLLKLFQNYLNYNHGDNFYTKVAPSKTLNEYWINPSLVGK